MSEQSQPHQAQHNQPNILSAQPGASLNNQQTIIPNNDPNSISPADFNRNIHSTSNERGLYLDSARANPDIEVPIGSMQAVGFGAHLELANQANIQRINQSEHTYRQESPREFVRFYHQFGGTHELLDGGANIQNPYSTQQYRCGLESGGVRDYFAEQEGRRDDAKQAHQEQLGALDAFDRMPGDIFGANRWNQDSPQNHNFPQPARDENDQKNLILNGMLMRNQYNEDQLDENINGEAEEQCQMIDTSNYNQQDPLNFALNTERVMNPDQGMLQQQLPQFQQNNELPVMQEATGLDQQFIQQQAAMSQPNQQIVQQVREENVQKDFETFQHSQQQQQLQQQAPDQQMNLDQKQIQQCIQFDNLENLDISSAHMRLAQLQQQKQPNDDQGDNQQKSSSKKVQQNPESKVPVQVQVQSPDKPQVGEMSPDPKLKEAKGQSDSKRQNQQKSSVQKNKITQNNMASRKTLKNEYDEDASDEIKRSKKDGPDSCENKPKPHVIRQSVPAEGPNYQKQIFQKAMQNIKVNSKHEPPKKPASAYIIFQKEKRMDILQRKPNARVTEVVKEIAQCWQALSKEDRMPYKEKARKDKIRYDDQIKQLEGMSSALKKPKKCLSAYMIFVKETRPRIVEENPNLGALDIMKKVGQYWQELLAKDGGTKEFQDKADVDKLRYLKEQQEFYDEVGRIKAKGEKDAAEADAAGDQMEDLEGSDVEDGLPNHLEDSQGDGQRLLGAKRLHSELQAPAGLAPFAASAQQPAAPNNLVPTFEWKQKSGMNDFTLGKDQMFPQGATRAQALAAGALRAPEGQLGMAQLGGPRLKGQSVQAQVLSNLIAKNQLNLGEESPVATGPCRGQASQSQSHQKKQTQLQIKQAAKEAEERQRADTKINITLDDAKIQSGQKTSTNAQNNENQQLEKPKKPSNAFDHYHSQAKQEIINEYENNIKNKKNKSSSSSLPQKKIAKIAGEKWQHLNRFEKDKYERMAQLDNQRYEEEMKTYKRNLQLQKNNKKKVVEQVNIQETSSMEDSSCLSETGKLKRQKLKGGKPRLKKDFIKQQTHATQQAFSLANQNLIGQSGVAPQAGVEQEVMGAMRAGVGAENSSLMNSQQKSQLQEKVSFTLENPQASKDKNAQIDMSAIGGNLLPLPKTHQQNVDCLTNIVNQSMNNMSSVAMNTFNNVIKERLLTNKDVQELAGRSPNLDEEIRPSNIMGDVDNVNVGVGDKFGQGPKEMQNNEKSQEPLNRTHDQSTIPLIQGIEKYNKIEKMPNDKSIDHMNNDRSDKLNNEIERSNTGHFGNNQELADAIDMSRTLMHNKNDRFSILSQKAPIQLKNNSDLPPELISQDIFNDENGQKHNNNSHNVVNQTNVNQQLGLSQLTPAYLQNQMRNNQNQQRGQLNMNLGQLGAQQLLNLQQANGQLGLQQGLNPNIAGLQPNISIQDQLRLLQLQSMPNFPGGLPMQQNPPTNGLNDYSLNQQHLGNSLNLLQSAALGGLGNNIFQLQNPQIPDLNKIGFNNALIQQHQHYLSQINGAMNNQLNDKKPQQPMDQNPQPQDLPNGLTQLQSQNQIEMANDKIDLKDQGMSNSQPKRLNSNNYDKQLAIKEHIKDMIQDDKADKKAGPGQLYKVNIAEGRGASVIKQNDQLIAIDGIQEQNRKSNNSPDNSQPQQWPAQQQLEMTQLVQTAQGLQGQLHQEDVLQLQQTIQSQQNQIQELNRRLISQQITQKLNAQGNNQQLLIDANQMQCGGISLPQLQQKGQNDDNLSTITVGDKAGGNGGVQIQQDQKDTQSLKKNQDMRMNKQQQIQKSLFNSINQQQQLLPSQATISDPTQNFLQQQKIIQNQQNQMRSIQQFSLDRTQKCTNQYFNLEKQEQSQHPKISQSQNKVQMSNTQNNQQQLIQQQFNNKLKYVNSFDKGLISNVNNNRVMQQSGAYNAAGISCNTAITPAITNPLQLDPGSEGAQQQYQQMIQQQQLLMRQQFQQQQARQDAGIGRGLNGCGLNVGGYGVSGLENMNNVNGLMTNQNNLNMLNHLNNLNGMQAAQRNVGMNPQGSQGLNNFNSMNINMSMNMNLNNLNGMGNNFGNLNGLGGHHLGQNLTSMQNMQNLQNIQSQQAASNGQQAMAQNNQITQGNISNSDRKMHKIERGMND